MKVKTFLLFLVLVIGTLHGCNVEPEARYEMRVGSTGDREIAEIKDTLKVGETVSIELEGNKVIGTPITILFIKNNETTESIIGNYEEHIDPTWGSVHYQFDEVEAGDYTIRIFNKENELLGEVSFTMLLNTAQ